MRIKYFGLIFLLFLAVQSYSQISTVSDGEWFNPNNWSTSTVPTSTDEVLVKHNMVMSLSQGNTVANVYEIGGFALAVEANNTVELTADSDGPYKVVVNGNMFLVNPFTIIVGDSVYFDVNGLVSFSGTGTKLQVDGKMEADSIYMNGAAPEIHVKREGEFFVTGGAKLYNAILQVDTLGSMQIGGDMEVLGGWPQRVEITGDVFVDGKITLGISDINVTVNNPGSLITDSTFFIGENTISGNGTIGGDITCSSWIGDCSDLVTPTILPVELIEFYLKTQGNVVELHWKTAVEEDNDFFTIERSADGENYKGIGVVNGAGTSYIENSYCFSDEGILKGVYYYRLKQTDYNGAFAYSNAIVAFVGSDFRFDVSEQYGTVKVFTEEYFNEEKVQVINAHGRVYDEKVVQGGQVVFPDLPNGFYLVRLVAQESKVQKVIVR